MRHPYLQTYHLWYTSRVSTPRFLRRHPRTIKRTCKNRICIFSYNTRHSTRCGRRRYICAFLSSSYGATSTTRERCSVSIYSTCWIPHLPRPRGSSSSILASRPLCTPWPSSRPYTNSTSCRFIPRSLPLWLWWASWCICLPLRNVSFPMQHFRLGFQASSVSENSTMRFEIYWKILQSPILQIHSRPLHHPPRLDPILSSFCCPMRLSKPSMNKMGKLLPILVIQRIKSILAPEVV